MKPIVILLLTACCVHTSARTPVLVSEYKVPSSQDEVNNASSAHTSVWSCESVTVSHKSNPTNKYPTPLIQLLALFDSNLPTFSGKSVKVFSDKKMSSCDYYNNVLMKQQCCNSDDTDKNNFNRSYI